MGIKYKVAEKTSFVHGGRLYKPGDMIDSEIFNKEALSASLKGGKLITVESPPEAGAEAKTEAPPEAGAEAKMEAPPETGAEAPGNGQRNIDAMSNKELRTFAAEKNIQIPGGVNREELLTIIKAALAGGESK